ncbi:MAG TPA: trypsin-like serine protease, partial [Longimicrobiales bacterium]|nr:trypsin-like serine protease [Longimicrobiales bacterium]
MPRYRHWASCMLLATLAACSEQSTEPLTPKPQFIWNGFETGPTLFSNVGALMVDFVPAGVTGDDEVCTGSLISETVFLTAAHCVAWLPAGHQVYVTFDDNLYPAPKPLIAATAWYYDPAYGHDQADLHDLAVVILPKGATKGIKPLALPPAGYLDELAAKGSLSKTMFDNVGYGTGHSQTGKPAFPYDGLRKWSKSEFMALQPSWLGLLMNTNATGEGGDCYGDSGGPKFLDSNRNMVVATVTTGDFVCRATTWDYRLDTPSARNFLGK